MSIFFEFTDLKRKNIFHIPLKEVTNDNFLEDVSLCMKHVLQGIISINEFSIEALDLINNEGWLFKDFANEMLIHVHRVELMDKPLDIQVMITQNGLESTGDVIIWSKDDL